MFFKRIPAQLFHEARSASFLIIIWLMSIGSAICLYYRNVPIFLANLGGSAVTAFIITLFEVALPLRRDWVPKAREIGWDAMHLGFNQGLIRPVARIALTTGFASVVEVLNAGGAFSHRPDLSGAPIFVQVIATMLVVDIFFYAGHRSFHRVETLWRYHLVHHAPRSLYWMRSIRLHFVEVAVMAALNLTALSLIKVKPVATLAALAAAATLSTLQHANIRLTLRWMSILIMTPELHRIHHSTRIEEEQSNYSLVFSFWDRLFGTLHISDTYNIGAVISERRPVTFMDDLLLPWRARR